jgi:ribosomal protein S18 acetylase RimI-like enzyme
MLVMAAMPEPQTPELVDLWEIAARDLDALLEEEIRNWRSQLDWDFTASADLVRRFVDAHALNGYALVSGGRPVGYCYYVCEEHKGLIGDLYVRDRYRTADNEQRLLGAVVDHLMRGRHVRRIESQLMLARLLGLGPLPGPRYLRSYQRNFMMLDIASFTLPGARNLDSVLIDQWTERRQDEAATVISTSYRGHIDSEINDQYRSASGARRFLFNIVQYPGCGTFHQPASWVAMHGDTGRLCGVCLTSLVAPNVGHITQICVAPAVKGTGVGYELLRHALGALLDVGVRKVSLTVTAANEEAVRLYERLGFRTVRQFPAFVWEGF